MRLLPAFFGFLTFAATAQDLPADRRIDWAGAGYPGCVPTPERVLDAGRYGVSPQNPDNGPALATALAALGGRPGVVQIPAGTFRVSQTLALPGGAVLRGAGSGKTRLVFDFGGATDRHAIAVEAPQTAPFTALRSGFTKGSRTVTTVEPLGLTSGEYAEIRQANGAWDTKPAPWAAFAVGQIVRVTGVDSTRITFEKALRIDYTASLRPEIRKLNPVSEVGLESLTLERTDSPASGGGSNVSFVYAARCWLRDVESIRSIGSHVLAEASTQLDITGNYFHQALTYDGASTRGYGVTLIQHTGECLVENNILETLRHALMVKQGANGNVIAYNFSTDPRRVESPTDAGGDLSLHGHFPFANLFEGNVAQTLHLDQAWGPAGPGNTFLRNRLERYGILMTSGPVNADGQNFIGNEITNAGTDYGNYLLAGTGHFTYANLVRGTRQPAGGTAPPPNSYVYAYPNDFWDASPWPGIGPPRVPGTGGNPARERYRAGQSRTVLQTARPPQISQETGSDGTWLRTHPARSARWEDGSTAVPRRVRQPGTYVLTITNPAGCPTSATVTVGDEPAGAVLVPNPSDGRFVRVRNVVLADVQLFSVTGHRLAVGWERAGIDWLIRPGTPLVPGVYLLRLTTDSGTQTRRWVVR